MRGYRDDSAMQHRDVGFLCDKSSTCLANLDNLWIAIWGIYIMDHVNVSGIRNYILDHSLLTLARPFLEKHEILTP